MCSNLSLVCLVPDHNGITSIEQEKSDLKDLYKCKEKKNPGERNKLISDQIL